MKIFLDTANTESIKKWAHTGVIDGITTNPTNLSKEGDHPVEQILAICDALPSGVINVEIVETEPQKIYTQAQKIASLCDNIVVKIPCHIDYYPVIQQLITEGITLNITLVFSLVQGLMMAKLGAHYISPFVARLDENHGNGIELIKQLRHMIDWYNFNTEILAASIRTVTQFEQVITAGADIATLPVKVFEDSLAHPLTDQGMEKFLSDWQKLKLSHFP